MSVKCESRSKGEVTKKKHLCPAEQAQFSAFFRQTEASRKRARRVSHAWKEGYKKRKAKPAVPCTHINCSSYFFPRHRRRLQQTWFYVEATFSPKKWRLQVNICFYASESYKKVIYLNVSKSLQLFWCFQMRMRTSFVNLVRLLPSEDKSHKWHLSHPIVYSCCCLFFKFNSVRIPNLLLYVLVNTSAMHFADASRIASSMENDTLRFCWKIFDYHMIFTNQFDRNGGSVGSIYFFALLPRAHLTLVSVRQWDAKKLRRFCKQDKAWCDIVGNRLSIRKIFLNIELPS